MPLTPLGLYSSELFSQICHISFHPYYNSLNRQDRCYFSTKSLVQATTKNCRARPHFSWFHVYGPGDYLMQRSPVLMIYFTYTNPGFLNNYANLAQNEIGLLLVVFYFVWRRSWNFRQKKFKVTTLYLSTAMKQNFGRELKLPQKGVVLFSCFPNLPTANTGAKVWTWILISWINVYACICLGHLLWTSCSEYWVTYWNGWKTVEQSQVCWSQVHKHSQWEKLPKYAKEL